MNLYFLLEGEKTEIQLYPNWLSYLLPELSQVFHYQDVQRENYFIFGSQGIPHIYSHTANAIRDINSFGHYSYLIVCLDADALDVNGRKKKLLEYLDTSKVELNSTCKLEIIVQYPCIETWFLGNRRMYKRNPHGDTFRQLSSFYNVSTHDPELLPLFPGHKNISRFHETYLREMLKEYRISYRKSKPGIILEKHYFDALMDRLQSSHHVNSLRYFVELCLRIKKDLIAQR